MRPHAEIYRLLPAQLCAPDENPGLELSMRQIEHCMLLNMDNQVNLMFVVHISPEEYPVQSALAIALYLGMLGALKEQKEKASKMQPEPDGFCMDRFLEMLMHSRQMVFWLAYYLTMRTDEQRRVVVRWYLIYRMFVRWTRDTYRAREVSIDDIEYILAGWVQDAEEMMK